VKWVVVSLASAWCLKHHKEDGIDYHKVAGMDSSGSQMPVQIIYVFKIQMKEKLLSGRFKFYNSLQ